MRKHFATIMLLGGMALVGLVGYSALKLPAVASGPTEAIPLVVQNDTGAVVTERATPAVSTLFTIDPGEATARFKIDEILRGEPKTVIGATDQVAAQIALDLAQPSAAQVGPIRINARTLTTDDSQRNRMLQNFILSTAEHEYITFTPSAVTGLPSTAQVGSTYPLQITGDLTIKGVTREVTFDATVTPRASGELEGSASTDIRYADWGVNIPSVPFVAGVADRVQIELEFVADTA